MVEIAFHMRASLPPPPPLQSSFLPVVVVLLLHRYFISVYLAKFIPAFLAHGWLAGSWVGRRFYFRNPNKFLMTIRFFRASAHTTFKINLMFRGS